jgi:hypothetical protein
LAINAWGDGSSAFLTLLDEVGVADWRIRQCADAATAIALAREHGHVAFVGASSAAPDVAAGHLHAVALSGMPRWAVRIDLLHRTADRADPTIRAVVAAVGQMRPSSHPRVTISSTVSSGV